MWRRRKWCRHERAPIALRIGRRGASRVGVTNSRPSRRMSARDRSRPGRDPLTNIEGRWILQILLCLNAGEHRFADLRSAIPEVSANVLTDRLRALECARLVERRYLPPPHASHVYALAYPAAALKPALDALARWRAEERHLSVLRTAGGDFVSGKWSNDHENA